MKEADIDSLVTLVIMKIRRMLRIKCLWTILERLQRLARCAGGEQMFDDGFKITQESVSTITHYGLSPRNNH